MMKRHNSNFIGKYEEIEIVGFKSQFTQSYGNNEENYFAKVEKGIGINPDSMLEGLQKNNFLATYIIGPILILNPEFTKKVLEKMGIQEAKIAFEEDIKNAYNQRLRELKRL